MGWRKRALRALMVVLAVLAAACDNIEWGGVDVEVGEPTYERAEPVEAAEPDTLDRPAGPVLPSGPVVFHVRRLDAAGRATIQPVAELTDDSLRAVGPTGGVDAAEYARAFVDRYYPAAATYTLFRADARVGTFVVDSAGAVGPPEAAVCRPTVGYGVVELRAPADTMSEFLAWPPGSRREGAAPTIPTVRPEMPELAAVLAEQGLRARGLGDGWRVRRPSAVRALDVGAGPFGFAATFVLRDSVAMGPPGPNAGMAFVVGDYRAATGYFPIFFEAARYEPGDKRVLRWLDRAELLPPVEDREWVLRAYGDAVGWYEVVGLDGAGERAILWSSRRPVCEAQQPSDLAD